jgi:hypothetical protein
MVTDNRRARGAAASPGLFRLNRLPQIHHHAERAWQRFVLFWRATDPGAVVLCSKAYSHDGARQPEFGRRNAIHRIEVKVV